MRIQLGELAAPLAAPDPNRVGAHAIGPCRCPLADPANTRHNTSVAASFPISRPYPIKGAPMKLTLAMRRNLEELADLAGGPDGFAGWGPESAGEWRCAEALERRGLLRRHVSRGERPFSLTEAGYRAVRP